MYKAFVSKVSRGFPACVYQVFYAAAPAQRALTSCINNHLACLRPVQNAEAAQHAPEVSAHVLLVCGLLLVNHLRACHALSATVHHDCNVHYNM